MQSQSKFKPTDLRLLAERCKCLKISDTVEDLYDLAEQDPKRDYFAVLAGEHPVGIVSREMGVPREATNHGHSIFKRKACEVQPPALLRDVMLKDPLIIEHGTYADIVFDEVFKRQGERSEEDIILVRHDGSYFGLISFHAICRLLYGFLGKHMQELRIQKEKVSLQHSQVVQVRRDLELTNQKLELARDKALESERMKSIFLANMSHEIRTPMNGVFGMIDLLSDTKLDHDQEELLVTARNSAETLMRIINDILDYSKIEAGKVSVESIPFNLTEMVESSVALYSEAASDKGIELTLVFEEVPPWVVGDPHRYQQVLNNLISNAVKFTDEGKVEVVVSGVATDTGGGILTEIADTGMGIPEEKIEELFKPFTQVDESMVRKFGGTGLGLSICSNLVELLNGTIECKSALGEGSLFSYVLPFEHYKDGSSSKCLDLVSLHHTCSTKTLSDRTDFSGMNVLLVEDNIVNQEVAKRFLFKLNCEVQSAENGQVALDYLNVHSFDCVFMDCQMPLMDGYDATRAIRSGKCGEHNKDIFISAMTAHAMSGDRDRCLGVGMDHYFSKPFGLQDFRKALVLSTDKAAQLYGGIA